MTSHYFLFLLLLLLLLAGGVAGLDGEERADHLLLLEDLPDGFSLDRPTFLDIRTNLSGTVRLVDSSEFRVVVNISAPNLQAAYKVKADLGVHDGGLLLQVREEDPSSGVVTLTWLAVGLSGATIVVLAIASLYACWWYRYERSFYDLAEKKSVAGSSQRGVYRSRNSLQVVNLPPLGDLPIVPSDRGDEADGPHNDDSLKQVPEMPEEEEAEAIEMEELTSLKLKDMDSSDPTTNESDAHRLTPQERNLIKNQLHSQNKNIHKDLLKKDKSLKAPVKEKPKQPPRRRTPTGLYTGVASSPEIISSSAEESMDSETDMDVDMMGEGVRDRNPSEHNYENMHKPMSSFMSPQRSGRKGTSAVPRSNMDAYSKSSDQDRGESGLQVMADVHKVGTQPEIVKVSTPDKQTHSGFVGSLSPDAARPPLTTFNSPAQLPAPPPPQNKMIRFKEPQEAAEKPPPPPVPPKHNPAAASRFVQGFSSMGDIPEDPREDCESLQSGRSRSLYGSSEIFDANNPIHTYYNLEDSDIEIPPLDAEDFFSDGGLPSPRSLSLGRKTTQDDSSLTGPRSMMFGRDSSLMGIPKPRPNSSIIPRMDHSNHRPSSDSGVSSGMSSGISSDQTSTPVNSEVDSSSPKLPPPPLPQEDLNSDGSAFSFPPPPNYFSLQHSGTTGEGGGGKPTYPPPRGSVGEYVTLPNNSTKGGPATATPTPYNTNSRSDSGRGVGGSGGTGRLGPGSKFTHLTLLSLMTVLALTTGGVYCKMRSRDDQEGTRVDITVFAPLSFLSARNNTMYFNLHKDTAMEIEGRFKVRAFVLDEPVLTTNVKQSCLPSCQHGCDEQTGQCICHKGYRLIGRFNCMDVNECAEGFMRCHPSAGCLNTKGSYTCVCSEDYYGDGKTCQDCNTPCQQHQYEEQNCSKSDGKIYEKICKDCTQTCPKGYYMASQCSDTSNARCRVCQPPCLAGEYEYRTCSNYHDRQCRNATFLPAMESSENLIVEEDRKVVDSEVTVEHLPNLAIGYTRYSLRRGTGLHVDISIQTLEAAQQFVPRQFSSNISIASSSPAVLQSYAVHRFCPHPVPDHYILHYTKHQDVTYQLDEQGEITPCHTFKDHGNFPSNAAKKENSFLCREPGSLTKLFEISPDIFQTTTHWAEKSKRCEGYSEKCEQCTRKCAQHMIGGSSDCSIVGDDNDNGWSPRLQVCYNCCARSNCTADCRNYHRRRCQPLKCHYGSLVEFSVFPTWGSSQDSKFFCHIRPARKQRLLEMKYTVRSDARKEPVHSATVKVEGGEEWETHGRVLHRDKLLNILIDSQLRNLPDFLEGRISMDSGDFHVGTYIKDGSRVETSVVSGESIRIHPMKPFGVRVHRSDPQKCENDIMKESLIAGEHQSPYTPDHDLMAVSIPNASTPFLITRTHQPPTLKITADRGRSFLKEIFPWARLTAGSLTGRMTQNRTHWGVEVMGSVEQCPGYLKVVLSDPAYRHTPLFSADVAVTCPRAFHLRFHLPSGDAWGLDRQVVASVADSQQAHHLRLHRPAAPTRVGEVDRKAPPPKKTLKPAPMKQKTKATVEKVSVPEGFIFTIPFMISVGGAVFLMVCLLLIGLIVQPGVPAPEPPILRCHHALFMVIYVVFQFVYSIIATSSIFFLVIIAVNSPRVAFIQQHLQQSAATSATHQLELSAMQTYLQQELRRQDTHMDNMRALCKHDMTRIVADMKKLHSQVVKDTEGVFQKHKLEVLLEEHRHRSMQQLAQDLLSFRAKYDQAVRTVLVELNHNMRQAQRSVENNTWLAGARFLHGVVSNMRQLINNKDTQPFMQWAHLNDDLSKLIVDVTFSLPSLPKLAEIEEVIESQPSKRSKTDRKTEKLHTTHVYNQWFSPFSHNATWDSLRFYNNQEKGGKGGGGGVKSFGMYYVFLVMLGCLDLVLVIHRMLKAKIGGQLLLYGYPEYMDFRERKEDGDDDVFDDEKKCNNCSESPFCKATKVFFSQVMSSGFVPKAVIVVVTVILLRGLLHISSSMLTVKALHKAGLYHSSEDYLDLHGQLINSRLQAHSHHINTVDFPAYQTWMSTYIQRHHFAFQVYQQQLRRMQRVHMQSYCHYLQSLELAGNCSHNASADDGVQDTAHGVISPACQFQPVLPKLYQRSESVYRNLSDHQLKVLLDNIRAIIFDTCQIVVVFLAIIVLKELLCAVLWIFIRRSGLIRLRIIYETDQDDPGPTG